MCSCTCHYPGFPCPWYSHFFLSRSWSACQANCHCPWIYMCSHLASHLFLHYVDGQVQISDSVLSLGVLTRILNPVCWEGNLCFFSYRPSMSLAWLCWKLTSVIGQVARMANRGISWGKQDISCRGRPLHFLLVKGEYINFWCWGTLLQLYKVWGILEFRIFVDFYFR